MSQLALRLSALPKPRPVWPASGLSDLDGGDPDVLGCFFTVGWDDQQRIFTDCDHVLAAQESLGNFFIVQQGPVGAFKILENIPALLFDDSGMFFLYFQVVDIHIIVFVSPDGDNRLIDFEGLELRVFEFQQDFQHWFFPFPRWRVSVCCRRKLNPT